MTPEVARAARDTVSGAVAAAERLPEQVGLELVSAARDAFAYGFEVTAAVSAVIAIALAVLAGVGLRDVRSGTALDDTTLEHDELAREFSH